MARPPLEIRQPVAVPGRAAAVVPPRAAAADPRFPLPKMYFRVRIGAEDVAVHAVSPLHWPDGVNTDPAVRQTVTLRRAVGASRLFYDWRRALAGGKDDVRTVTVVLLAGPGGAPAVAWQLAGARAIRWTGPDLDAMSGGIAFEELEIAYETVIWGAPEPAPRGGRP